MALAIFQNESAMRLIILVYNLISKVKSDYNGLIILHEDRFGL